MNKKILKALPELSKRKLGRGECFKGGNMTKSPVCAVGHLMEIANLFPDGKDGLPPDKEFCDYYGLTEDEENSIQMKNDFYTGKSRVQYICNLLYDEHRSRKGPKTFDEYLATLV